MTDLNQCDGCRRGLPLDERGIHVDATRASWHDRLYMVCTANRYPPPT